jgi:hypothetical protein
MIEHPFWWLLTAAAVAWYSVITVYVAVKAVADIRTMLRHVAAQREDPDPNG